jgi:hypothetical protein
MVSRRNPECQPRVLPAPPDLVPPGGVCPGRGPGVSLSGQVVRVGTAQGVGGQCPPLPAPTDDDVELLTRKIARRLTRVARRFLEEDELVGDDDEQAALHHAVASSLPAPLLARTGVDASWPPSNERPLSCNVNGFSLHAGRAAAVGDREALERLCRYGLRAALAQERLSIREDGLVVYRLRRPWPTPEGVTALAFLTDALVVKRILRHLGLPTAPPPLAPSRIEVQSELVFDDLPPDECFDEAAGSSPHSGGPRAPP